MLLSAHHSGHPRVQAHEPSEPRTCPIFPCLFHSEGHHPPKVGQGYSQQRFVSVYCLPGEEPRTGLLSSDSLLQAATQMSTAEMSERPLYAGAVPGFQPPSQSANSSALQPASKLNVHFLNAPRFFFYLTGLHLHWLKSDWYIVRLSLIDFLVGHH